MMQNESEVVANKTVNPRKRKSRFLSTICDDKNEETCSRNYNITEEIERYQKEDPISANDSALKWWKIKKSLYPVMSKLATKYRVSHITGPTLFLLFSRVLEHIQRNFS